MEIGRKLATARIRHIGQATPRARSSESSAASEIQFVNQKAKISCTLHEIIAFCCCAFWRLKTFVQNALKMQTKSQPQPRNRVNDTLSKRQQ